MKYPAHRVALFAIGLGLAGCASGPALTTPITLPRSVPFAASARASETLRDECLLESNLAEHLRNAMGAEFRNITQVERITPATPGRTLTARISRVLMRSGGQANRFTSMAVEGVMRDNGRVIGSFSAYREKIDAAAGSAATRAGSCGQLLQLSKLVSQDIARWAREPRMNAMLGDKQP